MGTRAGIYVRISQDREGAGLGVQRQEQDARKLCKRKGWAVGEVYVDDDVSAYSGKPRPAWNRLRQDVEAGLLGAVAVWHVDRLTRSPRELEDVIDYAERRGLELATVSGDIDLATPTGRMVARMLGAAARHESEHKAERQRRERRQSAERGCVSGGGIRPYGYAEDRVTVVEDEAQIIREMAKRCLAGESLSSIARDLKARDVRTPRGNHWQPRTLRPLLASARISGRREHTPRDSFKGTRPLLGEIVADAVWPGIISAADSDRLRRILSDPSRAKFSPATGRTYLLSGILRCHCGAAMCGRPKGQTPRYVCPNVPGTTSCGSTATVAARTDDHVRDMVLLALDSPKMRKKLTRPVEVDPALEDAIKKDENALADLIADKDENIIARGEYLSRRARIEGRLKVNRVKQARATHTEPLADFVGTYDEMLARWNDDKNVAQKRAIVAAVLDHITVNRADPRKKWDPARFDPTWRA